jgi:hypothetical protein
MFNSKARVDSRLKQVHGASAKVAVIPDATIQYFPEGKSEPVGTLIQEWPLEGNFVPNILVPVLLALIISGQRSFDRLHELGRRDLQLEPEFQSE